MAQQAIYIETQRLHHNTAVRLLVPISCVFSLGVAGAVMVSQNAPASSLAWMLAIGLGVPLLVSMLPMRTVVTEDAVVVRSLLVVGRSVQMASVVQAQEVRYDPLADCGGWGGPRPSRKWGVVYNIAGDRGVHVRYTSSRGERSILIGSRRSHELARAIRMAANLPEEEAAHQSAPT